MEEPLKPHNEKEPNYLTKQDENLRRACHLIGHLKSKALQTMGLNK